MHFLKLTYTKDNFEASSGYLNKAGFHVVPAGFDVWCISISTVDNKSCPILQRKKDASLLLSYIFKNALLSHFFAAGAESEDYWLGRVEDILGVVLRGIMHGDIQNSSCQDTIYYPRLTT